MPLPTLEQLRSSKGYLDADSGTKSAIEQQYVADTQRQPAAPPAHLPASGITQGDNGVYRGRGQAPSVGVETAYGLPSERVYQEAEAAGRLSGLPRAAVAPAAGRLELPPARTLGGTAGDIGVTALKGAVGMGEAVQGLLNIPTLGRFGKLTEELGYRPGEAQEALSGMLSPAQQYAEKRVQEAQGFVPTLKTAVQHPSVIARSIGESVPLMLAGGVAGKGLQLLPGVGTLAGAALGEGAVSAGALAESIRQQTESKLLTPKQALAAIGGGVGTALFSAAGGRIASKLGVIDIDSLLAGAKFSKPSEVAKAIVYGGISEGLFEEMPQEMQETVWQNAATGKPLLEGAAEAGAQALLSGAAMGSGVNVAAGAFGREPGTTDAAKPPLGEPGAAETPPGASAEAAGERPAATTTRKAVDDVFEMAAGALNTGQLDPTDPSKAETFASVRDQFAEMIRSDDPEIQKSLNENQDILQALGIELPVADTPTDGEVPEVTVPPPVTATGTEILPKDQATIEKPLEPPPVTAPVKPKKQDVDLLRAQAIPENLRTDEEKIMVRAETERAASAKGKAEVQIRKQAEAMADEHPAHRSMTEAIKNGGINIDLAKKEGWSIDDLKDIRRPGLFSRKSDMGPDEMAQTLGYDTEAAMREDWAKAPTKKELKATAEKEGTDQYQRTDDAVNELESEGFQLGSEEKVSVGELNPGDEVVITDKVGVPEKLTHKGYDDQGNALLQDGVLLNVDPFEELNIIAKKTGDTKTADKVQKLLSDIIEVKSPEGINRLIDQLPARVKADKGLEPYSDMIKASLTRRLAEVGKEPTVPTGKARPVAEPARQPSTGKVSAGKETPAIGYPDKRAVETASSRGERGVEKEDVIHEDFFKKEYKGGDLDNIPEYVQRIEEPNVKVASLEKPHGIYTSPANVASPHSFLGGDAHYWKTNNDAKVLRLKVGNVHSTRGRYSKVGESAGVAAARKIAGDEKVLPILLMEKEEAVDSVGEEYPDVSWDKYFDSTEIVEAYGGLKAKSAGYDAIWGVSENVLFKDLDEYVALTKRAFINKAVKRVARQPSAKKEAPAAKYPDKQAVETALRKGEDVPVSVAKEYFPTLAAARTETGLGESGFTAKIGTKVLEEVGTKTVRRTIHGYQDPKTFQEERRDPKKRSTLTSDWFYKETLPKNTEKIISAAAKIKARVKNAEVSLEDNKQHLARLFDKAGVGKFTFTHDGTEFTIKKPVKGQSTVITREGSDAREEILKDYQESGHLRYIANKGVYLAIQPVAVGKSSAGKYGTKTLEAAASEHIDFLSELGVAKENEAAVKEKIFKEIAPGLLNEGRDHVFRNEAADTTFNIRRSDRKDVYIDPENGAEFNQLLEAYNKAVNSGDNKEALRLEGKMSDMASPEVTKEAAAKLKKEKEKPGYSKKVEVGYGSAGVSRPRAMGFAGKGSAKRKAEFKARTRAGLDEALKSVGNELAPGDAADIKNELTGLLGRVFRNQLKKGVVEVVSTDQAASALAGAEAMRSADDLRIEGLTFPDGKVWLVEGNIAKGKAAGVLAHELGVHARKLGFKNEKSFERILSRIETVAKAGADKDVNAAWKRAEEAGTKPGDMAGEAAGYLLNNAPQHGIIRRLIAAVKKFLAERGWVRQSFDKFSVADIQAMAQSAMRRVDAGIAERAAEGVNEFAQSVKKSVAAAAEEIKGMANFKEWFGDSKVVDKNGKPFVVYHGTDASFTRFDKNFTGSKTGNLGHYGDGFYFSDDIREAGGYGDKIIESFLSIKKPFIATKENIDSIREEFGHKKEPVSINSEWLLTSLKGKYPVGYKLASGLISEEGSGWSKLTSRDYKESNIDLNTVSDMVNMSDKAPVGTVEPYNDYYLDKINELMGEPVFTYGYPDDISLHHLTEMGDEADKLTRILKSRGYDGVIAGSEMVAFSPTQIKSIHNTGEWSQTDPDIMKSVRAKAKPSIAAKEAGTAAKVSPELLESAGSIFSAPLTRKRRNTENLNAEKDGKKSKSSAEAGNKAISSIMKILRKVARETEVELYRSLARERKFLARYNAVRIDQAAPVADGIALLTDFVRQSGIPVSTKARIGQLIKNINQAKRPETQRKRLATAFDKLELDISRRYRSKISQQVKRTAGPKKAGKIRRRTMWHKQEKDLAGIRKAVHMSSVDAESAIKAAELRLERLTGNMKSATQGEVEGTQNLITDTEVNLHHLRRFGDLKGKSIDELLRAKFEAEEIRKTGRTKIRAVKKEWNGQVSETVKWLAKEITGESSPEPETGAQSARRKRKERGIVGKAKGAYSAAGNSIMSWEFLLNKLAAKGSKGALQSRAVKELGSIAHAGQRDSEAYNRKTSESMLENGMRIFGVKSGAKLTKKLQKLSKGTGEVRTTGDDTIKMSPSEAAYWYSVRKEDGAEAVFKKMGINDDSFADINQLMSPELKEWADYLHDELLTDAISEESKAYRSVSGADKDVSALFRDKADDIPIMNINTAVLNRVYDANHSRAWAVPSKLFSDTFTDPLIRGYINQHVGAGTIKSVDLFLEDFAKSPKELRGDMAWMDKIRSNVVMAMIGANPTTFFKQLTSIPAYAADIPVSAFTRNFVHGLANFRQVKRLIDSSGMAKERFGAGFDRDVHEASKATAEQIVGGKVTRARDVLMSMTKLGDKTAIYAGYTVYKYHKDKALSEKKGAKAAHDIGIKEFEIATERTQQAAGTKDLGSFQRGGSLQKLFTMYMTSPAAYTRQTMAAVRHFKTDPAGSSKRLLIFNVMLPMMFQAVASGFLGAGGGDDEEMVDFWQKEMRAVALGPFMGVPIARDIASGIWESAMGSWYGSDISHSPVTETTKSLTQAIFHGSKGLREGDDKAMQRAKGDFLDFLGYIAGFPTRPARRLWEGWDDFLSGDTEHPIMATAGYSRWARKETHLNK